MTLVRKSLLVTLIVLGFQFIVVCSLIAALGISEERVKRLDYSRAAIFGASAVVSQFNEALFLASWQTILRNKYFETRYEQLKKDITSTLHKLRSDRYASKTDVDELGRLSNEAGFLLVQMEDLEANLRNARSMEGIALVTAKFKSDIIPYVQRMNRTAYEFSARHAKEQRALEKRSSPGTLVSVVSLMFGINILAALAYVIGFHKSIVRRLAIVTGNFRLFADNKPLLQPQAGSDEIAQVDREFHSLTRALIEASDKDKAVFNNMPVGLVTCDDTGKIQDLNPCALSWFGDIRGNQFRDYVDEPQKFSELFSSELAGTARLRIITNLGIAVLTEATVSRFVHQSRMHLIVALVDLSAREDLENQRQEFVNIVSHDIRVPIASACLLLDMIEDQHHEQVERTEYCQRAKNQLTSIMKLTTDLLDLARIDSGTIKLEKEYCSVGALIERAVEAVSMQAKQEGLKIVERPTDLFVECDSERIQQVLTNFLSNAIKYTPTGKQIEVSAQKCGGTVKISVRDEGIGIPEASRIAVFERFKQTRSDDAKRGTGLGLAICKLLVENHGGKVGVESVEGHGSEFWLVLPADDQKLAN